MQKAGHTVSIFCADGKSKRIQQEVINDIRVYRTNSGKYDLYGAYYKQRNYYEKYRDKFYEFYNKSIFPYFKKIVRDVRPNIVHINCISGISLYIFKYCSELHIPVVLTVRNYGLLYPSDEPKVTNRLLNHVLTYFFRLSARKWSNKADAVTAPSKFTLNQYLREHYFTQAKIADVVPNCATINIKETEDYIKQRKVRENASVIFLYAGWLTEPKGIRHMIRAFEKIEDIHIKLVICGDGYLMDYVTSRAQIDPRIVIKGKLNEADMKQEYIDADVLIVPSIWEEPFGRVIIEGNAYGLPVICTNKGGMPEIMDTVGGGCIYEAGNVKSLHLVMRDFLIREVRESYYPHITANIQKYSVHEQVNKFEEIYKVIT
jgi:glycosyltransferase involved in cell wall biosynthesis